MGLELPILNQPVLNQPRPHEAFQSARELESKLRATVRGEVRFDPASRALYAADASNYRATPIGVVLPHDAADVEATIAACRETGAAILPRGAGTSLSGQCCNVAVVLDFSKYMRRLVSLDPRKKIAVVEPGIVLDRVREAAEVHHLTFPPDPATHSRCTIGGMIGNNSCGTHSVMGGLTANNIRALDILLYDGTRMTVGATSEEEISAIIARGGRPGEIYAGLRRIRDQYADEIRRRFPKIPRRVSGYNLDELLPERGFQVARALVGSEGTLATVLRATLDLMHSPPCRRLAVLGFPDPFLAADAAPEIIRHGPIGLEGVDSMLLDFMRRKNLAVDDMQLLPEGGAFLLTEFGAETDEEAEAKAHALLAALSGFPGTPTGRVCTLEEAPRLWHIRESALGSTVFVPGEPHGWEGWEDAGVPPERLGSYLRELWALMKTYGYRSPMYGHFGQGCVHTRINFDLESEPGIRKFRAFLNDATDIVVAHGGSISGEHGDGRARAALLPKMFGPELMQAFREFKALWDPDNRMNPAILMEPDSSTDLVYQPEDNLRLGAGYEAKSPATFFQFPDDNGSFGEATLRCVGVGACRKEHAGTMCPSYMATREEQHSTRGRAHLLWELMEGKVLGASGKATDWRNESVREALDLCLSCKACKSECPVNVDVATYKAEFLAHYYGSRLRKPQHYAFGFMDRLAHLSSLMPGVTPRLANLPLATPGVSHAIKAVLGVAAQRTLPRFAPRSFQSDWREARSATRRVLLWPDTWNNYYHPQSLHAAAEVLATAGFAPEVPRHHVCCGRPLYDFGFLKQARAYLEKILRDFAPQIDSGLPFVFLEPSCASVFRDELVNFFPPGSEHGPRAQRLCDQTLLLSQFLMRHAPDFQPPPLSGRKIVLQGHCHHKSVMKMTDEMAILRRTGADVALLDSGCCGMAGPFGFERDKFTVSQALGERVLLPAVRAAAADTLLVADGFSCREQIAQNTDRRALHFAEVLVPPGNPTV
ncbi:MAG TPA: FAD-binding and (Fe-S)-binding domain-containing protein [Acidobacteriaceae bacterium]|jgi:FAD/FMN-containing dehydrogenase/Fe-S oxidoreductase|nr:FAD-binding and (Fe-S)-binding domain-containing protein [Acidobacteriaceae bacterium]